MNGDGPSTRAILRVVGVLLAVTLALWLIWVSRGVLTWVAIAAFLAVAINPLVNLLQDRLRLRRAPAILIVYVLVRRPRVCERRRRARGVSRPESVRAVAAQTCARRWRRHREDGQA